MTAVFKVTLVLVLIATFQCYPAIITPASSAVESEDDAMDQVASEVSNDVRVVRKREDGPVLRLG